MWPRGARVLTPVICGTILRCLQRCLASDGGLGAGHPAIQSGCHSREGDTAAWRFLSCLGRGGHVGEQEEEHFWPGPVSPSCDMRLSGRGRWRPDNHVNGMWTPPDHVLTRSDDRQQKNKFVLKLHKDIFIKAKLLRAQSSPGVLIEPELIDKSTIALFSLLNSIYHLIWVHEKANDC